MNPNQENEIMPFEFNSRKALQALAVLLNAAPSKTDNFMRLIKLLYMADRKCIEEIGRPITGDRVVAMERGPVLSNVYDALKESSIGPDWSYYLKRENYRIVLVENPGRGELCPYEVDKLTEVWERYQDKDEWEMVKELHKLPEYKRHEPLESPSEDISLKDILIALGQEDIFEEIEAEAHEKITLAKMFQG